MCGVCGRERGVARHRGRVCHSSSSSSSAGHGARQAERRHLRVRRVGVAGSLASAPTRRLGAWQPTRPATPAPRWVSDLPTAALPLPLAEPIKPGSAADNENFL